MNGITRRDALKAGAAAAGAAIIGNVAARAAPTWNGPAPEPGAQLRVLRWKQFIQSEFDSFTANTNKFVEQTGVKIRVDAESWDDIRPKAAVAANVGGDCGLRTDVIPAFGVDAYFDTRLLDELVGVGGEAVELRLDKLLPAQHSELSARFGSGAVPG